MSTKNISIYSSTYLWSHNQKSGSIYLCSMCAILFTDSDWSTEKDCMNTYGFYKPKTSFLNVYSNSRWSLELSLTYDFCVGCVNTRLSRQMLRRSVSRSALLCTRTHNNSSSNNNSQCTGWPVFLRQLLCHKSAIPHYVLIHTLFGISWLLLFLKWS